MQTQLNQAVKCLEIKKIIKQVRNVARLEHTLAKKKVIPCETQLARSSIGNFYECIPNDAPLFFRVHSSA